MGNRKIKSHQCDNCGLRFSVEPKFNNFCPNCGQENHNPRMPIIHYIYELLESTLHLDNKTIYTLRILIFHPGTITKDYINNVRARYTPPIRLFVFSLAIFILCLNMAQNMMVKKDFVHRDTVSLQQQMKTLSDTTRIQFSDPFFTGQKIYYSVADLNELKEIDFSQIGPWLKNHKRSSGFINRMELRLVKHNINTSKSVSEFQEHLVKIHYWVILLMLPFTACIIYLIFYYKGFLYYDALVMSFHFYAFGFIIGIILSLATMFLIQFSILRDTTIILPLDLIICVLINYLPADKKVFGLSWPSTIFRAMAVSIFNIIIQISIFWIIAGYIG